MVGTVVATEPAVPLMHAVGMPNHSLRIAARDGKWPFKMCCPWRSSLSISTRVEASFSRRRHASLYRVGRTRLRFVLLRVLLLVVPDRGDRGAERGRGHLRLQVVLRVAGGVEPSPKVGGYGLDARRGSTI